MLAILRARQMWGGERALPGLREALGLRRGRHRRRGRRRRGRGRRPARWSRRWQDAGWDPAARRRRLDRRRRQVAAGAAVRRHRGGAAAGAAPPTRSTRCCTPSTAASSRPGRPARRCAGWSTCCPPAATSTPSTPRRCRRGWPGRPVQAMADSLLARYRDDHGALAGVGRAVGVGHLGDADLRRRHRRSACAAGRSAGLGRGVAARRRPRGDRRWTSSAGRASTSPSASRGFFRDAFPHVVDDARRRGAAGRRPRRARRARTTSAPTRRPTSPSTATNGAPPHGSSAPSPAPTAPGCCS